MNRAGRGRMDSVAPFLFVGGYCDMSRFIGTAVLKE